MNKKNKTKKSNKAKEHRFKKNIFIILGSVVLLAVFYFSFKSISVQAEIATFYPHSCLGGWTNAYRAAGKPEVSDDNTNTLNNDNSALLQANTQSDIFCGDFKGTIPENSQPQKLIVSFSWDVAKNNGQDSQSVSSNNFKASAGDILDATSSGDVNFTLTDTPAEPMQPAVEPVVSPSESAPTSFLNMLATPVFAEEEISTTTQDVSSTSTPEVVQDVSTTTPEVTSTTSAQVVPAVLGENIDATSSTSGGNEILEVSYTLDGKTWESLGRVDSAHLRYSIFEIPISEGSSWDDISGLQIAIKTLPSIDNSPAIFLDGMSLQISYGKANTQPFVSKSGLYISKADTSSSNLSFKIKNSEGIQQLIVTTDGEIGNIAIFNRQTGTRVANTYAGLSKYVIQPESFGVGSYTFIQTSDPNSCTGSTFQECKAQSLGNEGDFTVGDGDSQLLINPTASTSSSTAPVALP